MISIKERKRFLNGGEEVFECELLLKREDLGLLRHITERDYRVGSLSIPKETVSYGFYWTDRPYVLYLWFDGGKRLGDYFNIADMVVLSEDEFAWRDLVVDILFLPGGGIEVLDEDELPDDLGGDLRSYIERAKSKILRDHKRILDEVTQHLSALRIRTNPQSNT